MQGRRILVAATARLALAVVAEAQESGQPPTMTAPRPLPLGRGAAT